ncbi:DUF3857 domain-containing protein [Gaoshiqia sp. Z1-71]|uniref:DUF3857 domain-containing protein n=1 Tax=Gaoshiqia hydrogeniformans TaxID=3290090 RepID=UPI003BF905C8
MKTTLPTITALFILLCFFQQAFSQNAPEKFGKIEISGLESKECPIDAHADAYCIFDAGETEFIYDQSSNKGFQLVFNRHLRVKILNNQGLSWGDFQIPIYQKGSTREEVTNLKAFTYNLEDGKIAKIKLEKSDILTEETSENLKTVKFAMPALKEGSVIEIQYSIKSDFLFNLQEWYFQRRIPTLYSEYTVTIPEYFNYNKTSKGYFPIETVTNRKPRKLTLTHHQRAEGMSVKEEKYTYDVDFTEHIYHFLAKDIPAFPNEKFLKTANNYLSKVEFELQYTKFPQQPMEYYTSSWDEIDRKLDESYNFGQELKRANHLNTDAELLKSRNLKDEALIDAALSLMTQRVSWNGGFNKYTTSTLSKAYKTGEGNSADVNLNLVMLLRALGFTSYPVILSTQTNGIVHPSHPSITSFNYVIAMVNLNGNTYLMDATDPNSLRNLLPVRCLNDKGRIIGNTADKWINLMDYKAYITRSQSIITLDSTLAVTGKIQKNLLDYCAYSYRGSIKDKSDPDESLKTLEEDNTAYHISNLKIDGLDSISNSLKLTYEISSVDGINNAGDMVYFSPALDPFFDENPFKLEKREFPVEFDYPFQIQRMYTITIPQNYEVSELPKPIIVKLPDNSGSFRYHTEQIGNMLNFSSLISINKSLFLPDEYELLKVFVQAIVDKEKEMVVLKSVRN